MAIVGRSAPGAITAALIASACGHAAAPTPPSPAPGNVAVEPAAPQLGAHRCAATLIPVPDQHVGDWSDGIFIDPPAEAEMTCDEYRRHCTATFPITFLNCRAESITIESELRRLDFDEPWVETTASFPHVIEPGAAWTIEASACGAGTTHASFMVGASVNEVMGYVDTKNPSNNHTVRRPVTMIGSLDSAPVHVTNPTFDREYAACQACNGEWSYGMVRSISPCPGADQGGSCVCRASDPGEPCDDSDDCDGWCEAEQFVVESRRGTPAVEYGHWTGHCSEFTSQRSCASPIPHGASHEPAKPKEISESCVD
jgi:hypothetical protein